MQRIIIFLAAVVGLAESRNLRGDFITAPNAPGTLIGVDFPFLLTQSQVPDQRFQQVYSRQYFLSAGTPVQITGLSFAPYPILSPIDVTLPNLTIHISTTLRNSDALSTTFAQNVGADDSIVFSGALHLFEDASGPTGPIGEVYKLHIGLQTPFVYDPSAGNLLIDVFNFQSISSLPVGANRLFAVDSFTDGASVLAGGVNSATGLAGAPALFTGFTYTPVPEPRAVWVLVVGIAVWIGTRVWSKRNLSDRKGISCR